MKFSYDQSVYATYFNDFFGFTAGDWTVTKTEAGASSHSAAVGNERFGVLVSTNDSNDDDAAFLQLTKETFRFVSGKRLHFITRLKLNDTLQSDLVAGLQITDTTPLAVSDGIYFIKDDGDRNLDFVVVKDGVSTRKDAIASLANDTYYRLEWLYDGSDHIKVLVDGVPVARVALTNVPDDEELAISFGHQNGEAVAKILSLDFVQVTQER